MFMKLVRYVSIGKSKNAKVHESIYSGQRRTNTERNKKHPYKGICAAYFRSEKSTSIGVSKKCDKSYLGIIQNVLILHIVFRNRFLKICPKLQCSCQINPYCIFLCRD